jgi:predicted ribosomally synthesized peptide with nif11-like leader
MERMLSMSQESAIQFFKAVDASPELKKQVPLGESDSPEMVQKVIAVANKAGYSFTIEDLRGAVRARAEQQVRAGELSEADLEKVAGGLRNDCTITCICTSSCCLTI